MSALSIIPILTGALIGQVPPAPAPAPATSQPSPLVIKTSDIQSVIENSYTRTICATNFKIDIAFCQKLSSQLLYRIPLYNRLTQYQKDFAVLKLGAVLLEDFTAMEATTLRDLIAQGPNYAWVFPRSWAHATSCWFAPSEGNPANQYTVMLPPGNSIAEILTAASKYRPLQASQSVEIAADGSFSLVLDDASVFGRNPANFGFTSCPGRAFTVTDAKSAGTAERPQLQISAKLTGENAEMPQELTLTYLTSPIAFYSVQKAKAAPAVEERVTAPQMTITGVTANTNSVPQDGFVTLTIHGTNLSNISADVHIGDTKLTASPSATTLKDKNTKAVFKVRIPVDAAGTGPATLTVTPYQNNVRKDDLSVEITITEKVITVVPPPPPPEPDGPDPCAAVPKPSWCKF